MANVDSEILDQARQAVRDGGCRVLVSGISGWRDLIYPAERHGKWALRYVSWFVLDGKKNAGLLGSRTYPDRASAIAAIEPVAMKKDSTYYHRRELRAEIEAETLAVLASGEPWPTRDPQPA